MTRVTLALAGRALRNNLRRVHYLAPTIIFPSLLLAVNVGGLGRTTDLPGFPRVDGFLDFQLAASATQSLMLGGVSAGIAMALDIESGFFDRLVAAPIPRLSIVLGRLLASAAVALAQVTYFLLVGLLFGASIHGGVPGALLILLIGGIAGAGFAALGMMLALRARSASTVQGIFPLAFVLLFLSSAFFPQDLLRAPADWVARYNPLSYIADGMRDPIISTVSATPVLEGLAAATGVAVAMVLLCVASLRGKLRTT